jgi:DNA-binding winged helix-turn-helix (wHTH) protein
MIAGTLGVRMLSACAMDGEINERIRYRFGVYEVNSEAFELRKDGIRIKLREQAFRILALMLEKPGELITREELRQRLWPDDTFGNFDKGLNTAISRLRDVLNDSAASPRFVETIPRHGYRFLADVQKVIEVDDKFSNTELHSLAPALSTETYVPTIEDKGNRTVPSRYWAALGLLTAGALAWFGYRAFWLPFNTENLQALPLTSYAGVVRSPSLSPDGSQVAFSWQPRCD